MTYSQSQFIPFSVVDIQRTIIGAKQNKTKGNISLNNALSVSYAARTSRPSQENFTANTPKFPSQSGLHNDPTHKTISKKLGWTLTEGPKGQSDRLLGCCHGDYILELKKKPPEYEKQQRQ